MKHVIQSGIYLFQQRWIIMMKFKMFRTSGLVTRDDRLIFLSRNDERTTRDRLFDYFLIFIVFFFQKIAWMWIERRRSRNRMGKDVERRERRNRWRVIGGFLGKCSINIAFSKNRWWNFSLIIENYYIYIYISFGSFFCIDDTNDDISNFISKLMEIENRVWMENRKFRTRDLFPC